MGKSHSQSQTFINDAAKIWNEAPCAVKDCTSLHQAKTKLKSLLKHYQFKLCKNCNFLIHKSLHLREINHYYYYYYDYYYYYLVEIGERPVAGVSTMTGLALLPLRDLALLTAYFLA